MKKIKHEKFKCNHGNKLSKNRFYEQILFLIMINLSFFQIIFFYQQKMKKCFKNNLSPANLIVIFVQIIPNFASAQLIKSATIFPVPTWETPINCNSRQIFNPITFKCNECTDNNLIASADKSECECNENSVPGDSAKTNNFNNYANTMVIQQQCIQCLQLGLFVSNDKLTCVQCKSQSALERPVKSNKCPTCKENEIVVVEYTNSLSIEKCVPCTKNTVPDDKKQRCVKCDNTECYCQKNSQKQLCSPNIIRSELGDAESIVFFNNNEQQPQKIKIDYIVKKLLFVASECQMGNSKQCQHLANICVLQDFSQRSENDACTLLEKIRKSLLNSQQVIPNLFYLEPTMELTRVSAIKAIFNFYNNSTTQNNQIDIVSSVYALNGTFLGLFPISDGYLNICSKFASAIRNIFKFGRLIRQKCRIDLINALQWNDGLVSQRFGGNIDETVFHELHLRYINENGEYLLYPIPVFNENILDSSMQYLNKFKDDIKKNPQLTLVRRFYFIDKQKISDDSRLFVRIPQEISLNIQLQIDKNSRIFPPHLRIRYTHFLHSKINSNNVLMENNTDRAHNNFETAFKIEYFMESFKYEKTLEVVMSSMCSLSLLFGLVKAYSWGRRAGRLMIDSSTIIKFILYACENISNVFLTVITISSIWIIFAYKYQKNTILFPLNYEQESTFIVYLMVSLMLNFIVLLHNYITLALVETFFIDWERAPLSFEKDTTIIDVSAFPTDVLFSIKPKAIKKQNFVVIWRTYMIANEWNKLQNYRKTSLIFQLLGILFLLEYCHFDNWALIQPGFNKNNKLDEIAETRMSRFSVDIFIYLILGITQWGFQIFFLEKIMNPFRNFMDLCSIANISVLAMTHSLHGYYIHGRSVHGLADTDMLEMNVFLQREKENICGLRGLENGSELQTFVVSMPRAFRDRVNYYTVSLKSALKKVKLRQREINRTTTKVENTAKIYVELNQFFKDLIDHSDPNCDYAITDTKLIEDVIGLELTDSSKVGNFKRDISENAYSSAFLYGNEWTYMSFEALLFCVIDMSTHSRIFSCFILYIISTTMRKTAKIFFTNNLIKSSLVDNRFLI